MCGYSPPSARMNRCFFRGISSALQCGRSRCCFVSGYSENALVRGDFIDAGMDMLTKPFALDTLGAKVHAMINADSG